MGGGRRRVLRVLAAGGRRSCFVYSFHIVLLSPVMGCSPPSRHSYRPLTTLSTVVDPICIARFNPPARCAGRAELRNLIPCWVTEHGFGAVTERLLPQSNVSQRSSNMRSSQELYDIPIYTYLCYPIDLVISSTTFVHVEPCRR